MTGRAKVTAKQVLMGVRDYFAPEPVIREVVLRDPIEAAIWRRWQLDGWNAEYYAAAFKRRGDVIADVVPDGWTPRSSKAERRIDALVLKKDRRIAVEIKVTRADFRNESDEKRRAWRDHTHYFYYATPVGLLTVDMLPAGCGLLEFDVEHPVWSSGVTVTRKAKTNSNALALPDHVVRAMFFRVSYYEREAERIKAKAASGLASAA